jgi:hypothetical protein
MGLHETMLVSLADCMRLPEGVRGSQHVVLCMRQLSGRAMHDLDEPDQDGAAHRPSVFFSGRKDGVLDAWDYYLGTQAAPALSTQACTHFPCTCLLTYHSTTGPAELRCMHPTSPQADEGVSEWEYASIQLPLQMKMVLHALAEGSGGGMPLTA